MASDTQKTTGSLANKAALLDATEQIMQEEGYAAVTSRRVAAKANIKPQLVHYHFGTMDDLLLATFRRFFNKFLERQIGMLLSESNPVEIWRSWNDMNESRLYVEFVALASHRKPIRDEVASRTELFREIQTKIIDKILREMDLDDATLPSPSAISFFLHGVRYAMIFDSALGLQHGHDDANAFFMRVINRVEKKQARAPKQGARGKKAGG